jgi:hypothetical protein
MSRAKSRRCTQPASAYRAHQCIPRSPAPHRLECGGTIAGKARGGERRDGQWRDAIKSVIMSIADAQRVIALEIRVADLAERNRVMCGSRRRAGGSSSRFPGRRGGPRDAQIADSYPSTILSCSHGPGAFQRSGRRCRCMPVVRPASGPSAGAIAAAPG